MRLLERSNTGEFSLTKDLVGDNIPPYTILSHTWKDGEEVTFEELIDGTGKGKPGYDKIRFCGEQARHDGLQYFWVDTCCINKSNNTELSEAINSMFRWYRNAAKCYVYLSDVSSPPFDANDKFSMLPCESAFRASRWFTRGWTLQELLAPRSVEFFSREGNRLGDKRSLERQIHEITGIAVPALQGAPLSQFGVDERFKWAQNRETTREEDWAYSLLGIFDIFMPLIYAEGRERAVTRLRKEINDASVEITVLHSRQVSTSLTSERRTYAFYSLEPISKKPSVKYWNYLTVTAMIVYEKVYNIAKDPRSGLVHFEAFAQQFPRERPSNSFLETIWKRIAPITALLPQNLTLALIYMLHVETYLNMTPKDQPCDAVIFSSGRRAILECYGNWVECACQCGRQWSFANWHQGLWRVGRDESGNERGGKRMCCTAARQQECNPAMRWRYENGSELMDKNRMHWLQNRQSVVFPNNITKA